MGQRAKVGQHVSKIIRMALINIRCLSQHSTSHVQDWDSSVIATLGLPYMMSTMSGVAPGGEVNTHTHTHTRWPTVIYLFIDTICSCAKRDICMSSKTAVAGGKC